MNQLEKNLTILYANRNRDINRIKISLDTLRNQTLQNFEVVFVDYGSEPEKLAELKEVLATYHFVRFYPLQVSQLLWNKSKAINYGIKKTQTAFVFIADVDLIFLTETTELLNKLTNPQKFFLFPLNYLDKKESSRLDRKIRFKDLKPSRRGEVNGMILVSKDALTTINGLDEFFHFYGAEDEDLFARLETAGYGKEFINEDYFYHIWHKSFSGSEDKLLTGNPRVKNIKRLNQRHFLRNQENGIIKPLRQKGMGEIINKKDSELLKRPDKTIKISNVLAHVEHFLREELESYKGEIVRAEFQEDSYYNSLKHKIKKLINKQTQPYCSMKEVNDMILKEILFRYRTNNYSYKVSKDLKMITFCIEL